MRQKRNRSNVSVCFLCGSCGPLYWPHVRCLVARFPRPSVWVAPAAPCGPLSVSVSCDTHTMSVVHRLCCGALAQNTHTYDQNNTTNDHTKRQKRNGSHTHTRQEQHDKRPHEETSPSFNNNRRRASVNMGRCKKRNRSHTQTHDTNNTTNDHRVNPTPRAAAATRQKRNRSR